MVGSHLVLVMPTYDFQCPCGEITTLYFQPYETAVIPCPLCGSSANRVTLSPPNAITETGGVGGPWDRNRRNSTGEKLEQLRKTSVETKRQTGKDSGPFKIRDWER